MPWNYVFDSMAELVIHLAPPDSLDDCPVGDAPKGNDDRTGGEQFELGHEVGVAGIDFGADRFIVGRQTLNGIGNTAIG